MRGGFEIVELTGAGRAYEGPNCGAAQSEGERHEQVDDAHAACSLAKDRSQSAMPSTVKDAAGMSTAACSAFTTPVIANAGGNPTPSSQTVEEARSAIVTSDAVPAVRFARPTRSEVEVSQGIGRIAAILSPSAHAVAVRQDRMPLAANAKVQEVRFDLDFDKPTLKGRHGSRDDSFEVYDNQFETTTPQPSDVDSATALRISTGVFNRLLSQGALDGTRSSISDMVMRQVHALQRSYPEGTTREWVDEYVFFVPTKVAGIPVGTEVQEYGVTVNVHKSGNVQRIEISGAALAANEPGAAIVTKSVRRAVRAQSGEIETKAIFGQHSIVQSLGQRFVVDENATGGDLVLRTLFQVSPVGVGQAGEQVVGKAFVASNAVDSTAPLLVSPTAGFVGPNSGNREPSK